MLRCHCIYKKITFHLQHIEQQKTGKKNGKKNPGIVIHILSQHNTPGNQPLSLFDQINYRSDCEMAVFWYDHLNMLAIHQILDFNSK